MSPAAGQPVITPPSGASQAKLLGVGAYRPRRVVANSELVERIDSSDEWIQERSGIVTRHWADEDEDLITMSVAAGERALAAAGVAAASIGAVIVATMSHIHQCPSAATLITHRLGAAPAAAFDLGAACAGFPHALAVAGDMIRGGSAEYVLVIGAERLSDFVNPDDRGTAFIFGDGAGAVVLGPSLVPGIGPTVWGSDGSQWDAIRARDSWTAVRDGAPWPYLTMEGQKVFRWAVWQMAPVAEQALEKAGIRADDLAAFIPHQANMRIIDAMAKALNLPDSVPIARDVAQTANTSAASIPLAMERMLREGTAPSGGLALLIGFGAGLSYAAQVVTLP